jgi:hypothetical protein
MKKKLTPEDHARIDRVLEEGRRAREHMQRILDGVAARQAARKKSADS